MAGQELLASAVIDWKKNKAHSASADHWSIPSPDVMIQVIHSVERQYQCAWWMNVLWVDLDVTVSSPLLSSTSLSDVNMWSMSCFEKIEVCIHLTAMEKMSEAWTGCCGEVSNTNQQKSPDVFVFIPVLLRAYFMIVDAWFRILGGCLKRAV